MAKPYSRLLDQMVGEPAEEAVGRHLETLHGVQEVIHYPFGEEDIDFQVKRYGNTYYVEVECRTWWAADQEEFPFAYLHVPVRKGPMLFLRKPAFYYSVRIDYKRAVVIRALHILECEPVPNDNRLFPNETFFGVPRSKFLGYEDL